MSKEGKQKAPDTVVERLRNEKEQHEKELRDAGYKDGYETAKGMSYDELCGLAERQQGYDREPQLDSWDPDIAYQSHCYEDWLKDSLSETADDWEYFDEGVYLSGWLQGVLAFWAEVRDQI